MSNVFFKITNQATYPAEKYKEIQDIQAYFKTKAEELAYQKDRTPQDAINFLNECFKKFPKYPYSESNKITKIEREISLYGTCLCMLTKAIFHDYEYNRHFYHVKGSTKYFDLSKLWLNTFDVKYDELLKVKEVLTTGQLRYDGDNKFLAGYVAYSTNEGRIGTDNLYKNEKSVLKIFNEMVLVPCSVAFDDNSLKNAKQLGAFESRLISSSDAYDFIGLNFNKNAAEFIDGNYEKRIMEAYKFLLDYFPKKKEETAKQSKNKF
uniref:hypothetical protein n=1 Tax=Pedobacter schmidteae TaxID=2201271 RepID=UPI0013CEEE96|nr:hypothetical protein [Pedobacter schmidteae]